MKINVEYVQRIYAPDTVLLTPAAAYRDMYSFELSPEHRMFVDWVEIEDDEDPTDYSVQEVWPAEGDEDYEAEQANNNYEGSVFGDTDRLVEGFSRQSDEFIEKLRERDCE